MTQRHITPAAWALLAALSLIWGSSFLVTAVILETLSPIHTVTHRLLWAAITMIVVLKLRGLKLPRDRATLFALLVMGAFNNALPFSLQAYALQTIETGLAGILNATTAVFGPAVAAIILTDERMTPRKALGVALGFSGIVTVMGIKALGHFDPRSTAQLAMLGSTLCYALSSVWARQRLGHLKAEVATGGMLVASALIMLPLSWVLAGPLPVAGLGLTTIAAIAYYSVMVTAVAYLLYYPLIRISGAGNATLVTLVVVPVAVILGAVLRAETLPLADYAGFGLIALGLLVIDGRLFRHR